MSNVVVLKESDADRYRDLCAAAPNFMAYYSWEYRQLVSALLGCKPVYLAEVGAGGRLLAALPLMSMEGRHGIVYNSLPFFGSHGGILAVEANAGEELLQAYRDLLSRPEAAAGTVILNPLTESTSDYPCDFIDERVGQFTSLDGAADPDVLLGRISASARYDIRLSQRANIEVRIDNNAFDPLRSLHQERMREIGVRAKSDAFFDLLPKLLRPGEQFDLFTAIRDEEIVALILLLYGGDVVEYFVPVVKPEHRGAQPTAAILFSAMQHLARRGFRLWNWGGTALSWDGVLRFKRNWGGLDRRYKYLTRVVSAPILKASPDDLLESYPGFYVVPFTKLISGAAGDDVVA